MLKINFCLSLPDKIPPEEARQKIKLLHDFCANRAFSEVGSIQDFEKEAVEFAASVIPEHVFGFKYKLAKEGPEFAIKLAKFPDRDRAPLVWYFEGNVWIPRTVEPDLYIIKYRAFFSAIDEANMIGFQTRVEDEAGFGTGRSIARLISAVKRDKAFLDPRDVLLG